MGGHVIFSHYAYFSRLLDALLPPEEWNTMQREAWVWMRDRFVPYPSVCTHTAARCRVHSSSSSGAA